MTCACRLRERSSRQHVLFWQSGIDNALGAASAVSRSRGGIRAELDPEGAPLVRGNLLGGGSSGEPVGSMGNVFSVVVLVWFCGRVEVSANQQPRTGVEQTQTVGNHTAHTDRRAERDGPSCRTSLREL